MVLVLGTAIDGGVGRTVRSEVPTAAVGSCLPILTATRVGVPPEPNTATPFAHDAGDFNRDGLRDVVVAYGVFNSNTRYPLRPMMNNGQSGFTDRAADLIEGSVPSFFNARKIVVADFNGDGFDDIFIGAHGIDSQLTG